MKTLSPDNQFLIRNLNLISPEQKAYGNNINYDCCGGSEENHLSLVRRCQVQDFKPSPAEYEKYDGTFINEMVEKRLKMSTCY
jgi:hypothetical protein